jgi:hypothetical protein
MISSAPLVAREDGGVGDGQQGRCVAEHDVEVLLEHLEQGVHLARAEQLARVRRDLAGGQHVEARPRPREHDLA